MSPDGLCKNLGGNNKMLTIIKSQAAETPQVQVKKKPTSEKKISANRANAQKSTGPRDTRRSRFNATKHGLRAAVVSQQRQQRMRAGEGVPAPAVLDVSVHLDSTKEKVEGVSSIIEQAFPDAKPDGVQ
jgi:hypothetical protein